MGFIVIALLMSCLALAHDEGGDFPSTLHFTTAEWPPYIGSQIPEQGAIPHILREALATQGYKVKLTFLPWARAVQVARDPALDYDGYIADYFADEVDRDFLLSQPVISSPLALVERHGPPLDWREVADLSRYRLGVVRGYINTREIDDLLARGQLRAERVSDDAANVRLLLARRVDAIVIDPNVMAWLLHRPAQLAGLSPKTGTTRILEQKALYACFRRTARGETLRKALDAGLAQIDAAGLLERYLARPEVTGASRK